MANKSNDHNFRLISRIVWLDGQIEKYEKITGKPSCLIDTIDSRALSRDDFNKYCRFVREKRELFRPFEELNRELFYGKKSNS